MTVRKDDAVRSVYDDKRFGAARAGDGEHGLLVALVVGMGLGYDGPLLEGGKFRLVEELGIFRSPSDGTA